MTSIVVFFDDVGVPRHMINPKLRPRDDRRFMCSTRVPRWWDYSERHFCNAENVTLSCRACDLYRQRMIEEASVEID